MIYRILILPFYFSRRATSILTPSGLGAMEGSGGAPVPPPLPPPKLLYFTWKIVLVWPWCFSTFPKIFLGTLWHNFYCYYILIVAIATTLLESIGIFGVFQNGKFSQFLTPQTDFLSFYFKKWSLFTISSIFDFLEKRLKQKIYTQNSAKNKNS